MSRLSEAELFDRYIGQGQTQARIATEVGVHPTTISAWLRDCAIPTRHGGRGGFSAETRARLLTSLPAGYAGGLSIRALAAEHGISPKTVHIYLRAAGVPLRPAGGSSPRLSVERQERLVAAYEGGASIRELAAQQHLSPTTVRTYLRAAGVPLRSGSGTRPGGVTS